MDEVRRLLAEELDIRFAYPSAPELHHSTRCLVRTLVHWIVWCCVVSASGLLLYETYA